MKVLLINITLERGSTGKIVAGIKKKVEDSNDNAYVAYGFYNSNLSNSYKIKCDGKVVVCYELLRIKLTGYHGYTSKRATQKLIKKVKEINPDIINMHNIHSGYLNLPMWFSFLKEYGKPIVWTLHDCWAFTGHCAHYSALQCTKWKEGCYNCENRDAYPGKSLIERSKEQWLDKRNIFTSLENMVLVTPSNWLRNEVKQSFLSQYSVRVIQNGIDLCIFRYRETDIRKRLKIEEKKVVLGVAMSWSARKGLDVFLSLDKLLDENYRILLVGLKENYKLPKETKIIPISRTLDQCELAGIYSASDFFVNPSLEETLGMTTVEAMACGTPAIVYNQTAVPEPVGENCGIILEENSPEEIKKAIKILENSNVDFRTTCRKHVEKHFNKEVCYMKYIELYREMLEDRL